MIRVATPIRLALLAGFIGFGCEKPITYTYFDVSVTIDRQTIDPDLLATVSSCAVSVEGSSEAAADLPCVRGFVKYDLGHFDYSTSARKGSLKFVVILKHNQELVGRGESVELGIVPNVTVPATVLVKAYETTDGGTAPAATADVGTGDAGSGN